MVNIFWAWKPVKLYDLSCCNYFHSDDKFWSNRETFVFFYTAQKHLQRGHIRAMYRLPYHFQLTLPFLPATPNRVNLKLLSPEQALCSEFVINPDLSITTHWLSSSPDGYTDVGDVNTGKRKRGSWSGGKAGERSLQRLMSEHLNAKCNPQHRGKSLGCLYNIQGRWESVPAAPVCRESHKLPGSLWCPGSVLFLLPRYVFTRRPSGSSFQRL